MQKSQGSYEKVILTLSALLAIGVAGYLVFLSRSFEEDLTINPGRSKENLNPRATAAMQQATDMLKQKPSWHSPDRNGKPVPLNKSVLLVMKGSELFDLLLPTPQFRPPMTNIFVTGDKTKTPPEAPLPNLYSPNLGDLDADNDGFSNLEEFNKKTDPRNAESMPPLTDKLFLQKRISHDYVVKLIPGSDGTNFQIQRLKPEPRANKFVKIDEEFGFEKNSLRFKIVSAEKKQVEHPTLGTIDTYALKVLDLSTKKEFELIDKEVNLAEYEAELEFRWKSRQTIGGAREGKTFQLPGLGKSYYILKLDEDKAIISPLGPDGQPTSEKIEIPQG